LKKITAISYSSSANLGSGFDTLALAHDAFHDKITLRMQENSGPLEINMFHDGIQTDPLKNTASYAFMKMAEDLDIKGKFSISVEKGVPEGLGLGSSGASAAGSVVAANRLLDLGLSLDKLTHYAMLGEGASSGSPHADNVAASIFGGVVFVKSTNPMKVLSLNSSSANGVMLIIPKIKIHGKTKLARSMVPEMVHMDNVISNSRLMSMLVLGLTDGDRSLLREGMNDNIVETSRLSLFPFYPEVKDICLQENAIGASISGAGPSIILLMDRETNVENIKLRVKPLMKERGIDADFVQCSIARGVTMYEE
jgi:homoserine kinase